MFESKRLLCFIAHRTANPLTGGELCSASLLEGAKQAGYQIEEWDGISMPLFARNLIALNFIYLWKSIKIPSKSIMLLDTDYHARYILSLLWSKFVKHCLIIGVLYHYNYWDKNNLFTRAIHLLIEKLVSKQFGQLITISNYSYRNFLSLTGSSIPHLIISPYVREKATSKHSTNVFSAQNKNFLSVGTIEHRKNYHNVFSALARTQLHFNLHIVGNVPSSSYYKQLVEHAEFLKISDRIIFHGRLDSNALDGLFSHCSIFVLVSLMEGYGMAYAEAMGYGIPIVGTTQGAVPELVEHGKNGFLCDPQSLDQITTALIKLQDQETWERISKNNSKKYETLMDKDTFVEKSRQYFVSLETQENDRLNQKL